MISTKGNWHSSNWSKWGSMLKIEKSQVHSLVEWHWWEGGFFLCAPPAVATSAFLGSYYNIVFAHSTTEAWLYMAKHACAVSFQFVLLDCFYSCTPHTKLWFPFAMHFCSSLQEGSYLLAHTAGDSSIMIYKSTDGKATRAYNLHEAHSDLPGVPSTLSVPWVPLDPNLPLPYHFAQGRVPCTFPPKNKNTMRNKKVRSVIQVKCKQTVWNNEGLRLEFCFASSGTNSSLL